MRTELRCVVNNKVIDTHIHAATTVLDFVRRELSLTGTKEGCREGDCGACTVLIGELKNGKVSYRSVNSCLLPVKAIDGKHLVTIEGLSTGELTPVQQSFVEHGATQCGFCTPGFIVSLTGYYLNNIVHTEETAIDSAGGNVCRCTGHTTIKRAISHLLGTLHADKMQTTEQLIDAGILPGYFTDIAGLLGQMQQQTLTAEAYHTPAVKISGGTDLFVQRGEELEDVEISFIPQVVTPGVTITGNLCIIDGAASVASFTDNPEVQKYLPGMLGYARLFGSLPIRNRATIAGNLANASPIGDMTSILMALEAELTLSDGTNERAVPLKNFYLGYKKLDKTPHEVIEKITFVLPRNGNLFNYEKVSKRTHLDIASVNSSGLIEVTEGIITRCSLSGGGVAATPLYLAKASAYLTGKAAVTEHFKEAINIALTEIQPISDARGTAEYKRILLKQLLTAHFLKFRNVLTGVKGGN